MNKIFIAILLLLSLGLSAQTKGTSVEIKLTEAQLKAAHSLHAIISDLPADCIVRQFNVVMVVRSSHQTAIVKYGGRADSNFPDDKASFFHCWKKGDHFFIEKINAGCSGPFSTTSYKIIVD